MQIISKKIEDVKPYENNPRDNSEAVDDVAKSLKNFGWQQPIVIDKDGVIIAGHTRYQAAQKLGMHEIPCVVADNLTPEQVKAYRIADNKTAEEAVWDMEKLDEELSGLDLSAFDWIDPLENFRDDPGSESVETYFTHATTPQEYTKARSARHEELVKEREEKAAAARPKGREKCKNLADCVDNTTYNIFKAKINNMPVDDEKKKYLNLLATKLIQVNYNNLAEYYDAAATDEEKKLIDKVLKE